MALMMSIKVKFRREWGKLITFKKKSENDWPAYFELVSCGIRLKLIKFGTTFSHLLFYQNPQSHLRGFTRTLSDLDQNFYAELC